MNSRALLITLCLLFPVYISSESVLTFEEAVAKTVELSPNLRIAALDIREKAGTQFQTLLYPNPVAAYSVENVFGNKNWHGWNAAESRYELAQLIETGGKRSFRQQRASFQYIASLAGLEVEQLSVLNRLLKAFVAVCAAQENVDLKMRQVKVARDVESAVTAKVEAGKSAKMQQNKAIVALANARIALRRARAAFLKNKERLSVLWGSTCPDFDKVDFPFYDVEAPPSFEACLADVKNNPVLVRASAQHDAARQNVCFERAQRVPDLTLTIGYKTLNDTGNRGFIFGASFPLPIFNRNQGNVYTAKAQALKAEEQYRLLEFTLVNIFSLNYKDWVRAYKEVMQMRTTVLKTALESFELARMGYMEGKFEYLDMLDAQKTLFEVREGYIQALLEFHQSLADIEYLTTQSQEDAT